MKFEKDEELRFRSILLDALVERDMVLDECGVAWMILDHRKRQPLVDKAGKVTGYRFPARQVVWKRDKLTVAGEAVWYEVNDTHISVISPRSMVEVIRADEAKFDASLANL